MDGWKNRTASQCREWAELYRTAQTEREAQARFDKTGLRWTEFFRLPYFDLPRMLVVDSMHNLFLGLLKEHFRSILGLQHYVKAFQSVWTYRCPSKALPNQKRAHRSENPRLGKLSGHIETGKFTDQLPMQRASRPEKVQEPEPAAEVELITEVEKAVLWSDLATMVKPSWLTSVPSHVGGESSDGKLKSDQWRTLGTVYLPITLIRMWHASEDPQRRELLDLTMDLVSAVILASSRITSPQNSRLCRDFLLSYRAKLKKTYPHYRCHPNHHMALHIPEFLLLFGPVHGWWTFPFERMIGKLQRVPTNYKPGKMTCDSEVVLPSVRFQANTKRLLDANTIKRPISS
ncbi:hypothetical protein C8R46DRAFT_889163 [Mycena filopes]|nr:hypothetical protein C8R46DRAFT_888542 [Mycena filopes]KAJ7177742.1 hypothetical protein C8R46DRAFT_889163 [Mycena filopes]